MPLVLVYANRLLLGGSLVPLIHLTAFRLFNLLLYSGDEQAP